MNRKTDLGSASAAPSSPASAANRVRATESSSAQAINWLLQQNLPQADLCIAAIGVVIQRADRACRPHEGLRHAVAPRLGSRRTCPAPPPCRSREAPLCEIK